MSIDIIGLTEAQLAVVANYTPRMVALEKLERYVEGTQYDGRPRWEDDSVPVWERAPCVVWAAAQGAITSNEDLLLGEGRYPSVTTRPDEDESIEGESDSLDDESSAKLDLLIRSIERQAKLRAHIRAQYCAAQTVGTAIGIYGLKAGKLFAESVPAKFATVEDGDSGEVVRLSIQYPYIDVQRDPSSGRWQARARLFRRVIDAQRDITYLPADASRDGKDPQWAEDKTKTVVHGLGFCPVVAHRFRVDNSIIKPPDGNAIHATLLDEIDAFNVEASIRHKGAVYSLPQIYEIGVQPGYNPTALQDSGFVAAGTASGGAVNPINNPPISSYRVAVPDNESRKKGPGHVWQFPSPDTKIGQLQLDAGALESLAGTMADLRARICETLAWVALNPEEIRFAAALSGKALERLMARQLNRVSKDRDGFGEYITCAYGMLLRIANKLPDGAVKLRGFQTARPVLASFGSESDWADPPLTLRWGAWFQPVPEDDQKLVDVVTKAKDAGLITTRTAVEKLARTFGIENVDAYLETLEEEREETAEHESKREASALAQFHGLNERANGITEPGRAPAGGSSQEANRGRSGGANPSARSRPETDDD